MPSTSGGKIPDIFTEFKNLIFRTFGKWGLIVFFLLAVAWSIWVNREHIASLPGLRHFAAWYYQKPIPQANPKQFSIAVAHLDGDDSLENNERLIVEALNEVGGIQVLEFDRKISVRARNREEAEKEGHNQAQEYLRESGADVLIWGTVLSSGGQTVLKLYWTSNPNQFAKSGRYQPTANLNLPQLFWNDVKSIFLLLILSQQNEYKRGVYVADRLLSYSKKVKTLIDTSGQSWGSDFRLILQIALVSSLGMIGEQTGDSTYHQESVEQTNQILEQVSPSQNPLLWAWLQNSLGLNLLQLGERSLVTQNPERMLQAFRNSLTVRNRQQFPLDWALTQSNLGIALRVIGEREQDPKKFIESVETLESALQEQKNAPADRALTQRRLASTLWLLGIRENDPGHLKKAEAAARSALSEWTPTTAPLLWAAAQWGLGNILQTLGQLEKGTERFDSAIESFKNAQKFFTRATNPRDWATLQNNIGNALRLRGEKDSSTQGTTNLKEALSSLNQALEVRTRKDDPINWVYTQINIGDALTSLGLREQGTKRLEEAVLTYYAALQIVSRKQMTLNWGIIHYRLMVTLLRIGERRKGAKEFCDALGHAYNASSAFSEIKADRESSEVGRAIVIISQSLENQYSRQELSNCLSRIQQRSLNQRQA